MVAVISGNGLGLGNTSQRTLGGQGGPAGLGQGGTTGNVNVATGNLVSQGVDEGVVFDGLSLGDLRTYNSLGQLSGSDGWRDGFSRSVGGLTGTLDTAGSTLTRTADDGSTVTYVYDASQGVYTSQGQSGAVDTLYWDAGTSTWTWTAAAAQQQETYNAAGQLTALSDLASGASYHFSYTGGKLSQIVAGDGDTLLFDYDTAGRLSSLSIQAVPPGQTAAVTRQTVSYTYDSQGRLSAVTTTLGSDTDSTTASYTTTYTYAGTSDRIASVTQSDGTVVSYAYTEDAAGAYQVTGITTGSGAAAQSLTLSYGTGETTVTDSAGHATVYQYDAAGHLTAVVAPTVGSTSPTTTYTYDTAGNVLTKTDPDGAVTTYTYDNWGNRLSVEDGAGHVVSYTYNAQDQVTSQTVYTVPAQGVPGQSGYVAPSGAQTTYDVYTPTGQLAYVIDPLGNVTEYDYATTTTGLSELATVRHYLGTSYSLSGLSPSTPPTLTQMQAWTASSAVQATLAQTTRTDYTYDVRGQLATQTVWDTVNGQGQGVLDAGARITRTTYDAQGQLRQTSVETGADRSTLQTTSYAYDGLGRRISSTAPLGNVTHYVYDDSAHTIAITQANSLTTTQTYDSAGRLISSVQSSAAAGQSAQVTIQNTLGINLSSTSTTNSSVQIAYQSHYITHPDGTGQWVEGEFATVTVRNAQSGAVLSTRLYATPLTIAQMTQLAASPTAATLQSVLTASDSDQINLTVYDSSGSPRAQVTYGTYDFTDPDGSIDAVTGELVTVETGNTQTIQYATPLTVAQLDALGNTPTLSALQAVLTTSPNDQITLNAVDSSTTGTSASVGFGTYRNADGVLASGEFITVTQYSSQGQMTARTTYVTPLTAAQVTSLGTAPTVTQIQALITMSSADQVLLRAYDSSGKELSEVGYTEGTAIGQNADGSAKFLPLGEYITAFQYDGEGKQTSILYATPLTASQVVSLGKAPTDDQIRALITTSDDDFNNSFISGGSYSDGALVNIVPMLYSTQNGEGFGSIPIITYLNALGETTSQIVYGTPLSESQLASLGSSPTVAQVQALIAASDNDVVQVYIHDASGRVVAQVNSQNVTVAHADGTTSNVVQAYVTTYTYDSLGRSVATTEYVTPLTPLQVESMGTAPTLAQLQSLLKTSPDDRTTLTVYDASGSVSAMVEYGTHYFTNADGTTHAVTGEFATVYSGSGAPQLYETPLTAAQMALLGNTPSFQSLQTVVGSPVVVGSPMQGRTTVYGYDDQGRQVRVTDPDGNTTYTLYDADGNVAYTVDAAGDVTSYARDADGNVIQSVQYARALTMSQLATLGTTPAVATLQSLLVSSTGDRTTTTIYMADGYVAAVIDPSGAVTTTTYDGAGDVVSTTRYATVLTAAQRTELGSAPTLAALQANLTGSANDRTTLTIHDADGHAVAIVDAEGYAIVSTYDAVGNILTARKYTTPLSAQELGQLNASPNMGTLQALLGPAEQTIYDASGNAVATIDAQGNVTVATHDAAGKVTSSVAYATPLTAAEVAALGSSPTLSALQADLVSSASDRITLTIYDANERVVGTVDGAGNVTATYYDPAGDATAVTHYATALAHAQVVSLGSQPAFSALQALLTPSASDQLALTVYDDAHQPVAVIDPAGNVTVSTYDTSGNLVASTVYTTPLTADQLAALGDEPTLSAVQADISPSSSDRTTLTIYDDANRPVATINPTGNVTTTTYDSAGNPVSSTVYATPLTATQLAALGDQPTLGALQADLVSSAADLTTRTIYDADNQAIAVIDPDGQVTVNTYDATGHVVSSTVESTTLTAAQLSALGDTATLAAVQADLATNAGAQIALTIYDANERPVATVDASGRVVTNTYDAAGNVTSSTQYATPLTAAQVATLASAPSLSALQADLSPGSGDQTSLTIHDGNERVVGTVSLTGVVTTTAYDAAGHVVATVQYATALTPAQVTSLGSAPTLAALTAIVSPSADDQAAVTIYDAEGRVVGTASSNSGATVTAYDAAGNVTAQINYATTWTAAQVEALGNAPTLAALKASNVPSQNDTATLTVYDADERPVAVIDPEYAYNASMRTWGYFGRVTTTTYGASGQVVATQQYSQYLTVPEWAALGLAPTLAQVQDMLALAGGSAQLTIYDGQTQPVATIVGSGVVTTTAYDSSGRVISTRQYATALTAAQRSSLELSPTLATLQTFLSPGQNDQTSLTIYDDQGRVLASVDPYGHTTINTYDAAGSPISVTNYGTPLTEAQRLALGSTPTVAALEAALGSSSFTRTLTIYDAEKRVVGSVSSKESVTLTTYDAAGNIATTTNYGTALTAAQIASLGTTPTLAALQADLSATSNDAVSLTVYDADERPIATLNNSHVTFTSYDASGNVIATVDRSESLTPQQVESLGGNPTLQNLQSLLALTDDSQTKLSIYDENNHAVATIANGVVTTNVYDAGGQVTASTVYATVLSDPQIVALEADPTLATLQTLLSPGAGDQTSLTVYGANGQAMATIDSGGVVAVITRDDAGNATATTQYATPLTTAQVTALGASPTLAALQADLTPGAADQTSLAIYDSSNRVVATVSSAGVATLTNYDASGNPTSVTQYATALTSSQMAALGTSPTLAALQADLKPSAADQTSLAIYDANNHVVATVSGTGATTVTTYDAAGNLVAVTQYATPLTAAQLSALGTSPTLAALQADLTQSAADQTSLTIYDANERVVATVGADGTVTTTAYDSAGLPSLTRQYLAKVSASR